jgi:hypothetical protein
MVPEHIVKNNEKTKAARAIVLTVEHLRYSLLHTPSNIRVFSTETEKIFIKNKIKILLFT